MFFDVHGPFEVPCPADGRIGGEDLKSFWRMVEEAAPGLSGAIGCYVAASKRKGRLKPIYVGKTTRLGFARECFTPHKQLLFLKYMAETKGTLHLFFLPKMTPKGRYCGMASGTAADIDFLEWYRIGLALARNPGLRNRQDTRMFRGLTVSGILNSGRGKPSSAASALKRTLGLARSGTGRPSRLKSEDEPRQIPVLPSGA